MLRIKYRIYRCVELFLQYWRHFFLSLIFISIGFPTNSYQVEGHTYENRLKVEYLIKYPKNSITRDLVRSRTIPKDYILAMIAIHECINICKEDTPYIIESSYNRELLNWGNYGDVYDQILSTEFRGLIDKNFYFNPDNPKHLWALNCARMTLEGRRLVKDQYIVGWTTYYDSDITHVRKTLNRNIITPTWHTFWVANKKELTKWQKQKIKA